MGWGVQLRLRLEGFLRRAPDIFEELLGLLVTVLGFLLTALGLREGRFLPELAVWFR